MCGCVLLEDTEDSVLCGEVCLELWPHFVRDFLTISTRIGEIVDCVYACEGRVEDFLVGEGGYA